MKNLKIWCCAAVAAMLVVNAAVLPLAAAGATGRVRLPSGKYIQMTQEQVDTLKKQKDMVFTQEKPSEKDRRGKTVIALPASLGGGYLTGTTTALAAAFNAVGVTAGLAAGSFGMSPAVIAGVAGVGAAGIIAGAASGGGDSTPTHTPPQDAR